MRIRIFIRPEKLIELLHKRGKGPAWLRVRVGVSPGAFSRWLAKADAPSPLYAKRIMKCMGGARWDDIFEIVNEGEGDK